MRILHSLLTGIGLTTAFAVAGCGTSLDKGSVSGIATADSELVQNGGADQSPTVKLTSFQAAKSRYAMRKLDELILFQPSKYPDGNWTPSGLQFEDVAFTSVDGIRLHAWFCPCEHARASILFLHGNAGNLSGRAEFLQVLQHDLKVNVLIVDYRGYGKSQGKPTIAGAMTDVRAASRELAERVGISERELIVWGRSLGGALAVQLAAQTQPRALIIECSFSSLKEVAAEHFPKLAWVVGKGRLNSAEAISQFQGELLQCHGTADRVISFESGERLFQAASEPKEFLRFEGLGHNSGTPVGFFQKADELIARVSGQRVTLTP